MNVGNTGLKKNGSSKLARCIQLMLLLPLISVVNAELPQNEYICHVLTRDEGKGVVFVQANNQADAAQGGYTATAILPSGQEARSDVIRVVECVGLPSRLSDKSLNRALGKHPR